MMKKFALVAVTFCLILVFGRVQSASSEERRSNLALDMAIVIDETQSMRYANNQGSDNLGYRHDAAAALMGLCDVKYSRVALIPFSTESDTKVLESNPYLFRLLPINVGANNNNRKELIKLLLNDEKANYKENLFAFCNALDNSETDLGSALEKAVNLLLSNDIGNRRVIVLLTDGDIKIGLREEESRNKYKAAYDKAAANGIRVYTIGLNLRASNAKLLRDAAERTGGQSSYIESRSPERIPEIFNSFFMNMVGSESVSVKGKTKNDGNGKYMATLTIPNKSIAETNILVPVGNGSSVRVITPSNKTAEFDETKYLRYSTTYFTLIKILEPKEQGNWLVEYTLSSKTPKALQNIEANVIFSYDVTPQLVVPESVYKTDTVKVSAVFKDKNGNEAKDSNLYQNEYGKEFQIHGSLSIFVKTAQGKEITKTVPMEVEADQYSYVLSIADLFKEYNISPSQKDELTIQAHLQGSGIDMYTEKKQIHILNRIPQIVEEELATQVKKLQGIQIHDPFRIDFGDEAVREINLIACVRRLDNEPVTFELLNSNDPIFGSFSLNDGVLKLSTINRTGSTTLKVSVTDTDGGQAVIELPGNVNVVLEEVCANYCMVLDVDNDSPNTNDTVLYTARLYDEKGTLLTGNSHLDAADLSKLGVTMSFAKDGTKQIVPLQFEKNAQGDGYFAVFTLSPNAASYEVQGEVTIQGKKLDHVTYPAVIKTNNTAPSFREGVQKPSYTAKIHDPLTEDELGYMSEWKQNLDLSDYVEDVDLEALTYTQVKPSENSGIKVDLSPKGKLTIAIDTVSGKYSIHLRATDPEGDYLDIDIPVSIRNIRDELKQYQLTVIKPEDKEQERDWLRKNTRYSIRLKIAEKDNSFVVNDNLNAWLKLLDTSNLKLVFKQFGATKEELVDLEWAVNEKDKALVATFTTGSTSGEYKISGFTVMRDEIRFEIPDDPTGQSNIWTVGNLPPVLMEEYAQGLQTHFEIEPMLWRTRNERVYEIDLASLFQDSPTDKLTYYVLDVTGLNPLDYVEAGAENQTESALWEKVLNLKDLPGKNIKLIADEDAEEKAHLLRLQNTEIGVRSLILYAEDTDQQRVAYIYRQEIISQKDEVIRLIILGAAALFAVFLFWLFVYWVFYRKKWTIEHGEAEVYVNGFYTGVTRNFKRNGKDEMGLIDLQVTQGSTPSMSSEIRKAAQCYKLRPGQNGSVIVRRIKPNKTKVKLTVSSTSMERSKKAIWPVGTSLKLTGTGDLASNVIEVKRTSAKGNDTRTKQRPAKL